MITEHDVEYHISTQQMLKYLEHYASMKTWSSRLGISRDMLYFYKRGERKIRNKGTYESILAEYYRIRTKERIRKILKIRGH